MYSATFYKNFMKQKSLQTKNCVTCVAKTAWCKGRRLAKSCCPSHQGIMEHNICWCHGAKMWILGRNTENCLPTQMFKFSSILKQGILWSPVWSKVQCSAIWPIFMYLHFFSVSVCQCIVASVRLPWWTIIWCLVIQLVSLFKIQSFKNFLCTTLDCLLNPLYYSLESLACIEKANALRST